MDLLTCLQLPHTPLQILWRHMDGAGILLSPLGWHRGAKWYACLSEAFMQAT